MEREELKIVFMGTPEFAVAPLKALCEAGYPVAAVVTVADKPAGRGRQLQQSAVKQWAVDHQLPVLQPLKLKEEEFLRQLKAFDAHLFVVVAFRMLPQVVWAMPPLGTFNLHASLLPQYRGAAPINHAVINGETTTGLTTFLLDEQMDTGSVLMQEAMEIGADETAGELHDRMMVKGAELVVATCDAIRLGTHSPVAQSAYAPGQLRAAPKIFKENCLIDWNQPAETVRNLIRGLSPYPGAFTRLLSPQGEELVLKIFRGRVVADERVVAGAIQSDGKSFLQFACTDGWYQASEVQLSGRKRLKTTEFLRGIDFLGEWKVLQGERN